MTQEHSAQVTEQPTQLGQPNEQWQKIAATHSPHELAQGHTFWLWAYRIGIFGSFAALAMFIVERMAGTNEQIWYWTSGQYLNGGIGLIFAFSFSAFVYGFYLTDYTIRARLFIFSVAVIFPLFAEVSQTMHRGGESTRAVSQSSPEFKAAQQALAAMTNANPTASSASAVAAAAGAKAKHEAELKACARYESETRRDKCRRYETAKIAEADGNMAGYSATGNAALAANQQGITQMITTVGQLGNNAEHSHEMVKFFMEIGMSALVAALIMSILIIGSIEAGLAWLGDHVKQYQKAMRARGLEIGNQKKAVISFNSADNSPALSAPMTALTTTANAAKQTVAEYAEKFEQGLKASPEIIATEYARADYANKQVLADVGNIASKIGKTLDNKFDQQRFLKLMYAEARTQILNGGIQPTIKAVSFVLSDVIKMHSKTVGELPASIINADLNKMAEKMLEKLAMERVITKTNNGYALSSQFRDNHPTPAGISSTIKMIVDGVDTNKAKTAAEIKQAVYNTYSVIPNPVDLDDSALDQVADKIAAERKATSATVSHFAQPSPTAGIVDRNSLTALADRNSLTGQRNSVNEVNEVSEVNDGQRLADMSKKLAKAEQALAQKIADTAEKEAADLADRLAAEKKVAADLADRIAAEASAQAKVAAEEEERKRAAAAKEAADRIAAEASAQAKVAAEEEERKRAAAAKEAADRIAAEKKAAADLADRIAAEKKAAADLADRAERGSLTDEQIEIAVNVIRNAVNEAHISSLGSPTVAPLLKAAGLPTSTDSLRALSKLACRELALEGLVIPNPRYAKGQPLYIIA
jgi:hypothetical protein